METDRKELIRLLQRHVRAESSRDLGGTLATLAPDCVFEDMALGETYVGHEGATRHYLMWWEGLHTTAQSERLFWTSGGGAVAEATFLGRHDGEFLGVAPTGREVEVPVAVFIGFRDGLMTGERLYWNAGKVARQLNS
jgi:steroid delta-isomerase-like uncharacterized protein